MLLANLVTAAQKMRPLKVPMLVVALSATLALLFTIATSSSEPEPPRAAGEAKIQLMNDEHALIADLVRSIRDSAEAERLAAKQDREEMRLVASAQTLEQKPPSVIARPAAKAAPVRVALPLPKPATATAPPLQLQVATAAPRPEKPVVTRARAALATVQRIPDWLRTGVENVADWAITAPGKAISQLPERRFL